MHSSLRQFSAFVCDLNARAREDSVEGLARWGTDALSGLLGFDCAWYGWAQLSKDAVHVQAQCAFNLPEVYYDAWTEISSQDLLADGVWRNPGHAASYARSGDVQTDGMIALSDCFGLKNMATGMDVRIDGRPSFYMSVYRGGGATRAWNETELEFLQCAVEQLAEAMKKVTVAREAHPETASIYVNAEGVGLLGLNALRARLGHLLPDMHNDRLPDTLVPLIREAGEHVLSDRQLVFTAHEDEAVTGMGLRKLTLRKLTPFDLLTQREREVARALANGKSHKETARLLGIAPSTVRNQTQAIYTKLNVGNRSNLTAAVAGYERNRPC